MKPRTKNGYSLIELMVAIGVFATVVAITSGTFVTSLRGQRKTITAQNVADNARYAMETMAKEIRMGKSFSPSGDNLQFTSNMPHRSNKTVRFNLTGGAITFDDDASDDGVFPDPTPPEPITSSNIVVSSLSFDVDGVPPLSQPRITIVMKVHSSGTTPDVETKMDLQTTVSQRSL